MSEHSSPLSEEFFLGEQASIPSQKPSILAIVVLYKHAPSESQSLRSLVQVFNENSDLARHFTLLIYDNSPQPHISDLKIHIRTHYKHDPSNGGLAPAYNFALSQAAETQHKWLLLLDQDTSPTRDFIAELVACTNLLESQRDVASIVPKLVVNGKIYSPAADFIDQIRHQYKRSTHAVSQKNVGIQKKRLGAYNSGATLRVLALQSVGGFPEAFWLDYLDHAVFHALSSHCYGMYVMGAMIEHDSSQANMNDVPLWRQRNILAAQVLFMRTAGNFFDRFLFRIWLLRMSRKLRTLYRDKRLWRETALQALRMKVPKDKTAYRPSFLPPE